MEERPASRPSATAFKFALTMLWIAPVCGLIPYLTVVLLSGDAAAGEGMGQGIVNIVLVLWGIGLIGLIIGLIRRAQGQ